MMIYQNPDGTPLLSATASPPAADAAGLVVRQTYDPAARDLLGRLRFSEPDVIFGDSPQYGLRPLTWLSATSGANNTLTWDAAKRAVLLTLTSAGHVVRQSAEYPIYEPGRPVRVMLTGNAGAHVAPVVWENGQFDAANGVFWRRQADGTPAVVVRSSTTGSAVDVVRTQADWNLDPLDGTGASGFTLNLARNNLLIIEYVWLGAFGARWGVATGSGIIYCHQEAFANLLQTSYMQTASLPIRWALSAASAPATPVVAQAVCGQLESEGGSVSKPGLTASGGRRIPAALAVTTEGPVVAIRPAVTFGTVPNRVKIDLRELDIMAVANNALDWRLLYYPPGTADPITGGTWAAAHDQSAVEVNSSGTALDLTGAYEITRGSLPASAQIKGQTSLDVLSAYPLTLNISGAESPLTSNAGAGPATLVLAAIGASATAAGSLRWGETY
jgi:hypothetical protein